MSLTFEEAIDDINGMIVDSWTPTGYSIFFEEVKNAIKPTPAVIVNEEPHIKVFLRHVSSSQKGFGGPGGTRRFTRIGVATIQLFTLSGFGLQESSQLGKVLVDTFEGKHSPGGVWFRDTSYAEAGRDGRFFQANISTTFIYDEIK